MNYFWMLFNQGIAEAFVGDIVEFDCDPEELSRGTPVQKWVNSAYVAVGQNGQDGPPDDVLQTAVPVPIFSNRLRNAIESAGIGGIQYLPVQVYGADGLDHGTFFVANVITTIEALDPLASTLRRFPNDYFIESRRGRISAVERPVLRAEVLGGGSHIFRLGDYHPSVFVSERFRDIFKLGRFTGVDFSPVQVVP